MQPKRRVPSVVSFVISVSLAISACLAFAQQGVPADRAVSATRFGAWGVDTSGMDPAVKPGDDFFLYANGKWLSKAVITSDRTSTGPFSDLGRICAEQVHALLEQLPDNSSNSNERRVGTLYHAFMNEKAIEQKGAHPLQQTLQEIRRTKTKAGLARIMGRHGFEASLFDLYIEKDRQRSDRYAVYLGQGGLGLPDRDYYLDKGFAEKKRAYGTYIAKMLALVQWPQAADAAASVLEFETRIAEASWRGEEVRDGARTYHPMSIANLRHADPDFPWTELLASSRIPRSHTVIVTTDTSVATLSHLFAETPLSTLQAWEAFHTTDSAAPFLAHTFAQAAFDFRGHTLRGLESRPDRWLRAVNLLNTEMGSAIGRLYIARYFPPERKTAVQAIADNMKQTLRTDLLQLSWMQPSTRAEAVRKLDRIAIQMGYPERWRSYAGVHLYPSALYADVDQLRRYNWEYKVGELGTAWNKNDWRFWPQESIAYTENGQLVFPAGMLQPPFFDVHADTAVNYGSIGHVIGHELTHAFDDQGRMEDSNFQTRDWWAPEDTKRYKEEAARLAAQYSAMEPLPGVHIRGDLTLGENLADFGGLVLAYKAYQTTKPSDSVEHGFSSDQEFFLGYAQVCREKDRPDALRAMLASDVHSPAKARLNGVVRNMPEWYSAFQVTSADRMYIPPDERVSIW